MEFTQEKIKKSFDKANPRIQEILLDTWITEDVSLIGKKFGLRIDKINILIRIIGYVILNLIPLSKLIDVIEKEIDLNKEKSSEIAEKIDEFIFAKIREKVREENKDKEVSEDEKGNIEATEELRDSLIKDIEEHAEEFGEPEEGQSFSDMFNKNKTTVKKKNIDLYRENL